MIRQMFSGIVEVINSFVFKARYNIIYLYFEDIGVVESLKLNKEMLSWDGSTVEGVELVVKSPLATQDAYKGCSIAINGVCLTVIDYTPDKVH
jgi:riboflavin synthase alpha subunit